MKQCDFLIISNANLASNVYEMILEGDISGITAPGQFVQIALPGFFLRRPISVCDAENNRLTLIYKVVGSGTEVMSHFNSGMKLNLLTGLGNGYDLNECGQRPLLVGGGAGVPPLYLLAKKLTANGKQVCAILGFNSSNEVFYEDEFKQLGVHTVICTMDGSYGVKGYVTDAMNMPYSYIYACGPEPMLKAVYDNSKTSGSFSFEERMGCGFGACMGCTCKTKYGHKRICKDGPVLKKEEIVW